jgi:hypothetical protein
MAFRVGRTIAVLFFLATVANVAVSNWDDRTAESPATAAVGDPAALR